MAKKILNERDIDKLELGDIVLVKSHSIIGWAIGESFHVESPIAHLWNSQAQLRPHGHDGVVGIHNTTPCVFESTAKGFIATPVRDYMRDVEQHKCQVIFARLSDGLFLDQKLTAHYWVNGMLGTRYDYRAYLSLVWRVILNLPSWINTQDPDAFFCTEAVSAMYRALGVNIYPKMPTPLETERLVADGLLQPVVKWI